MTINCSSHVRSSSFEMYKNLFLLSQLRFAIPATVCINITGRSKFLIKIPGRIYVFLLLTISNGISSIISHAQPLTTMFSGDH